MKFKFWQKRKEPELWTDTESLWICHCGKYQVLNPGNRIRLAVWRKYTETLDAELNCCGTNTRGNSDGATADREAGSGGST